jgi:hypothetical protein
MPTIILILILNRACCFYRRKKNLQRLIGIGLMLGVNSVAKPHHFYTAPAPGKNFDAAPAAPAPTLLYSKAKNFKTN